MTRLVGIYREPECSPGQHRFNDAWLLDGIGARLRGRGLEVDLRHADDLGRIAAGETGIDAALIFSMCQGPAGLERLARLERDGARIVNSPRAALNTYRDRLPGLMAASGVPYPRTDLIATDDRGASVAAREWNGLVWLKRGNVHASVKADVQRIESRESLAAAVADFAARGIRLAAVQAHVEGDEIKFYGVGRDFFYWFHSAGAQRYPVDEPALVDAARRAADAAGLEIFGGDVIVSPDGGLTLIDLNDWPSFAPCRDAAVDVIADYLARRVHVAGNYDGLVSGAIKSAV